MHVWSSDHDLSNNARAAAPSATTTLAGYVWRRDKLGKYMIMQVALEFPDARISVFIGFGTERTKLEGGGKAHARDQCMCVRLGLAGRIIGPTTATNISSFCNKTRKKNPGEYARFPWSILSLYHASMPPLVRINDQHMRSTWTMRRRGMDRWS